VEGTVGFKATYTVWGANHNFYNTEWQEPDASVCFGHRPISTNSTGIIGTGSDEQRQTGFLAMLAFFLGNVGPSTDNTLNQLFDPRFPAPADRVDRGFHPGSSTTLSKQLEDFTGAAGTSTFGLPNGASNITITHGSISEHEPTHSAGTISWTTAGNSTFFQSNWAVSGSGFDLSTFQYLDLRVDRSRDDTLNAAPTTDFRVMLVNGNNTLTGSALISTYLKLEGPVGRTASARHSMLQTARIPLTAFSGATLTSIRGVRLVFNSTASGKIYVANIRATKPGIAGAAAAATLASTAATTAPSASLAAALPLVAPPPPITAGNAIVSLRTRDGTSIEITVSSTTKFGARDEAPVLAIGAEETSISAFPNGDLKKLVFRLSRQAFDRLRGGELVSVRHGRDASPEWTFGPLDKTKLDR